LARGVSAAPAIEAGAMRRAHEKGNVLTIEGCWPGNRRVAQQTSFEAWREEHDAGTFRTISGPPPAAWHMPEQGPSPELDPEQAWPVIAAFAGALGAPATLRYSRLTSRRHVLDPLGEWRVRPLDVFAVTGRTQLSNGRFMSIGWSGLGDGLDRMDEPSARERLAFIAQAAGSAEAMADGCVPAVLDAQPAALIAHEAIGHFAEAAADPTVDLRHRLGCRLAGEGFDVFDHPTLGGAAHYEVDDEGVASLGPTRILHDGILTHQLHGRRSAEAAGELSTANARAAQITLPPIPRMSNLVVPAGPTPFAQLVDDMGTGIVIHQLSHGYSHGIKIEARVVLGELVERGRQTGRYVSGGRIAEKVDVLTRCVDRADRSELNPNALCGKHGQILYDVGTVAPAMRLSSLRIA
jgi:predicted Zn-dependent protease